MSAADESSPEAVDAAFERQWADAVNHMIASGVPSLHYDNTGKLLGKLMYVAGLKDGSEAAERIVREALTG